MDVEALEDVLRQVMGEMMVALAHLHQQGFVHKDVKLENFVFKEKGVVEPRRVGSPTLIRKDAGDCKSPTSLKLIDFDLTVEWRPD